MLRADGGDRDAFARLRGAVVAAAVAAAVAHFWEAGRDPGRLLGA